MPYDINNPPKKLHGLSPTKQRQWIHVYESCMAVHGDDIRCQKEAWGVTGGFTEKSETD